MGQLSKVSKAGTDFFIDGCLLSAGLTCATAWIAGDSILPSEVLIGFGLSAVFGLAGRRFFTRSARSQWAKMASNASAIYPIQSADPGMRSYKYKWKPEAAPPEFEFVGPKLPVRVLESELARFVGIARRRKYNALHGGGRLGLHWTKSGFRQLKLNWVLSESYFCKEIRPRFPNEKFYAILIILGRAQLLDGGPRRQGHTGYLVGDFSTSRYVELAIERWLRLTAQPPKWRLFPFKVTVG